MATQRLRLHTGALPGLGQRRAPDGPLGRGGAASRGHAPGPRDPCPVVRVNGGCSDLAAGQRSCRSRDRCPPSLPLRVEPQRAARDGRRAPNPHLCTTRLCRVRIVTREKADTRLGDTADAACSAERLLAVRVRREGGAALRGGALTVEVALFGRIEPRIDAGATRSQVAVAGGAAASAAAAACSR